MTSAPALQLRVAAGLIALAGVALAVALGAVQPAGRLEELMVVAVLAPPAVVVALRVDPAWTLSAAIAASMFSGRWAELGSPVPLDRGLLALAILNLAVRSPLRPSSLPRIRGTHLVLLAAAAYAIGSAMWFDTLGESKAQFALLDRFGLIPFAAFVLAPMIYRTRRQREILLTVLGLTGAYLGVVALLEGLKLTQFVWPAYVGDASVGIHVGRSRGPFVEAGAMGLALFMTAAAVLVRFRTLSPRWRIAGIAVVGLCLVGIVLTLTRAAWLAAAVTVAFVLLITPALRRWVLPAAISGVVVVLVALAVIPGLAEQVQARQGAQQSVWDRLNSNDAALRMTADEPVFGFGWDRFGEVSPDYYEVAFDYPVQSVPEVHNVVLSNLSELGLLGTTLWLAALGLALAGALRRRGSPELRIWQIALVAIALNWFITANLTPLSFVFPNLLLWTWLGIVYDWTEDG